MDGFVITILLIISILWLIIKAISALGQTPEDVGRYGETLVARKLAKLPSDEYCVLHDLMIADKHGMTTQIDHIVISRFGVFVVETKCYKGWIFGNEKRNFWTQSLYAGGRGWFAHSEKHQFQNPIKQNWRHIYVLSEQLKIPLKFFFNIVVFCGETEFKTSMPDNVMDETDVVSYIRSFDTAVFDKDRYLQIVDSVIKLDTSVSVEQRKDHVNRLVSLHESEADEVPCCPRCGAPMRLRYRHSDNEPFYGCSRYPKCRGIVNVT